MTKKEYIFKVLDKLKGIWDKEDNIREYLNNNDDEEYINYLYDKFVLAVDNALKNKIKNKESSLTEYLNGIKIKESDSRKADEEDLRKLEQLLNTL